ncbi:MAG: hypothetical protein LIO70_08015 [Clostridiales bacterium]|nr:hypothetical protein [Clostridiales bacterium]
MEQMVEDAKKQHAFGSWSTNAPTHAIVHEIGHALEMQYLTEEKRTVLEALRRAEVLRVTGSADTDIVTAAADHDPHMDMLGIRAQENLSLYGISSVSELIAESIAQNILDSPGALAQQVVFILMG